MQESFLLGILFAVLASTSLNVGNGIQKWKVRVFGQKKAMFNRQHRKDLAIWLIGLLMTTSATPLFSFALKYTEKSSMVSALNGVGMIGLVVFAWLVLRERIGWQEISGALLVLAGTAVMGYFDKALAGGQQYSLGPFFWCLFFVAAVFGPLSAFSWKTNRYYGFTFGAIPGILIGCAMILGDIALVESGDDMLGQFTNPYPYIAIVLGTGALIVTQLAFWRSKAMVVVPTINSFVILTPVVFERFTFKTILQPLQYLAVGAIMTGVVLLTATEKQDRIEGRSSGEGQERDAHPVRRDGETESNVAEIVKTQKVNV